MRTNRIKETQKFLGIKRESFSLKGLTSDDKLTKTFHEQLTVSEVKCIGYIYQIGKLESKIKDVNFKSLTKI